MMELYIHSQLWQQIRVEMALYLLHSTPSPYSNLHNLCGRSISTRWILIVSIDASFRFCVRKVLGRVTINATSPGWATVMFPTPIPLTDTNQNLCIAYNTGGMYYPKVPTTTDNQLIATIVGSMGARYTAGSDKELLGQTGTYTSNPPSKLNFYTDFIIQPS